MELVSFNVGWTMNFEDGLTWMRDGGWDLGAFQEVPMDWGSRVGAHYGVLVGETCRGGRRCAVVWRTAMFEVKTYSTLFFPAVKVEHVPTGRVARLVSAHLAH